MKVAVVLVAALLLGCGRRSRSATPPAVVDAGDPMGMSGGMGGIIEPAGRPDAFVSSPDASLDRRSEDDGRADVAATDTRRPMAPLDAMLTADRGPDLGSVVPPDASVDARGGDAIVVTPEFHLTLPLSSSILTSRSPTFGWTDPGGTEYFIIEVCRDAACNDVIERAFSGLTTYTLTRGLDEGVVFFRARAVLPLGQGVLTTATWEAFVPSRNTGRDTAMLAVPDFNRDGVPDVAQATEGGSVAVTYFGPNATPIATGDVLPGPARALAYAVDVNADGYGDLLVARNEVVDIYQGGAAGLYAVGSLTGGAGFGARVAGVGDVNGDGFGDVMIGSQPDSGAGTATLFLSSRSGLGQAQGSPLPAGRFGAAGDVDADGFADVVICSPVTAAVSLYRGSASGLVAAGTLADPRTAGVVSFGNACQGAGDVTGDGFGDVIVTGSDQNLVAVLFAGGEHGLSTAKPPVIVGPAAGNPADDLQVASAGDVNRDGLTDVLLTDHTAVRLFLGENGGLATSPVSTLTGSFRNAAGLGDFNRDLAPDVVVGPRGCDRPVRIHPGGGAGLGATAIYTFSIAGNFVCPLHLLAR